MLKIFKNFTKKEWILIFISFCFIFAQVWLELKIPDYMSEITKLVQTEGSKMRDILINGGYMLLCAFGSLIAAVLVGYFISYISANLSKTLRRKLFRKVESLSIHEVKQFSPDSLITRTTNDITQIEMFVGMGLQLLIKAPITAIWAITKIANKSWQWSVVTGISVVIVLSVVSILMIIVVPKFKLIQKLIDKLNLVTRENLSGIRVVRAFNAECYQTDKFEGVNSNLTNIQMFNQKAFAIMSPMMFLVMHMMTLAIFYIGAYLIDGALMVDKISIFGDMIVFSSYSTQIIMSFLLLAMIFMIMPRAGVSAKRINEVLDTEISVIDGTVTKHQTEERGKVEFKNVSFKYPDAEEYLLKDISFTANKGETVAFIGSTGSGKSTLIHLIPRFYDVTDGEVLIDGVNVKDYKESFLHNLIGYVPQKAVMFQGTIKDNIAYGKGSSKVSIDAVKKAIKIAQANDFVDKMDKKEKSFVASAGTNISGGQKQRLSIARAIARNPEFYIFDDSFSALDYKTDATLRKELKKHTKDATTFIVAQRIGTILNADKIIVLDQGKCVGMGTHKELLKKCPIYKQIALSQLSKEELDHEGR